MLIMESKTIIFWIILTKFKEYIIKLTISVKMVEMGNIGFPEEFF
jgi:hypothetical protein